MSAAIWRQSAIVIGVTTSLGWFLMKGVEGTDDDIYKKYKDKDKKEVSYDKQSMINDMLRGGGKGDLRKLREETTKRRLEIAEAHTVYNVPDPSTRDK